MIARNQFAGWIPIRFYWHQGQPMVDWAHLGGLRFAESFFDQTIERCLCDPFNLLFRQQTSIECLGEWSAVSPGIKPTGFIFHLSRSGSTLISQMLAALPSNIVISEAPTIDSIVRAANKSSAVTDEERISWLRWMISAQAQQARTEENNFFVKFDAWHVLELPLIRRAFPDVPWLFVYRDPLEVIVSQLNHRGAHMVPGGIAPGLFAIDPKTAWTIEPEEYCARVLAALCEAALHYHADGGLLINYSQLPGVVWTEISEFFEVSYSDTERSTMKAQTTRHAKDPSAPFQSDSTDKRRKATDEMIAATDRWVRPTYERLESMRLDESCAGRRSTNIASRTRDTVRL